jgi:drug/metabolite transporter (DMT)-like permease
VPQGADWAHQVLMRPLTLNDIIILIIPSCCYFLTIALAGMGMLLIPASVAFMVQASCIIFTAVCSVVAFPGRKLNSLHIRGIFASMAGVGIVSLAGYVYTLDSEHQASSLLSITSYLLSPRHSSVFTGDQSSAVSTQSALSARSGGEPTMVQNTTMLAWGVLLTLLSQLSQALQFVSEEMLVGSTDLHPLQMLAVEGSLSAMLSIVALSIGVFLPGHDEGHNVESFWDTIQQLRNSRPLFILCVAQFLGVAGCNFYGLRVSSMPPTHFSLCLHVANMA